MNDLLQELNAIQPVSELQCDYRKTLVLLRALKAGTVSLDVVTMTEDGWTIAEVEPAEDSPYTTTMDAAELPEEVA